MSKSSPFTTKDLASKTAALSGIVVDSSLLLTYFLSLNLVKTLIPHDGFGNSWYALWDQISISNVKRNAIKHLRYIVHTAAGQKNLSFGVDKYVGWKSFNLKLIVNGATVAIKSFN